MSEVKSITVFCKNIECEELDIVKSCPLVFIEDDVQCGACGEVCEKVFHFEETEAGEEGTETPAEPPA